MNTTTTATSSPLTLQKVDRIGVAASILCAIHCGLAPILLLALPTFGRVWAHPASHILVAIFVVPLAVFSIRKGYRTHQRRWIMVAVSIGILFVLGGAVLPAFSKGNGLNEAKALEATTISEEDGPATSSPALCENGCSETQCDSSADEDEIIETSGCVDACCPSLQVSETGETSLHIPPAAIVTTMGGIFLIAAHIGNLCSCGHACRTNHCTDCA